MPIQLPAVGSAGTPVSTSTGALLGKDEFLKMLVTQLRFQDPLKPLEGTEFASQLAQFSSVEQLSNINESLSASLDANYLLAQSIGNSLAAGMIGKDVRASGNSFHVSNSGDDIRLGYTLDAAAESVTVSIYRGGTLVKTIDSPAAAMGDNALTLDDLETGDYTFSVEAKSADGTAIGASTYLYGRITGVRFKPEGAAFLVDGSEIPFSMILEILDASNTTITTRGL